MFSGIFISSANGLSSPGEMFYNSFIILAMILLLAVPAFILRKMKLLNSSCLKPLSIILLYICQPFLIINAFARSSVEPGGAVAVNLAVVFLLAIATHVIPFIILQMTLFRTSKKKFQSLEPAAVLEGDLYGAAKKRNGALIFLSAFGNAGFLGVNFIQELFGGDHRMIIYTAAFIAVFNIGLWTLGVYISTGDVKKINWKKAFLVPAVAAIPIGVLFFFVPQINFLHGTRIFEGYRYVAVSIYEYVSGVGYVTNGYAYMAERVYRQTFERTRMIGRGVTFLADASLPLSMFIVGIRLGEVSFKDLVSDKKVHLTNAIKLVGVPLLMLGIMLPLALSGVFSSLDPNNYFTIVIVIFAAMPAAASAVAFAERFDGDVGTSVKGFLLSTILSIITLPLILMATMALLG